LICHHCAPREDSSMKPPDFPASRPNFIAF